MPICMFMVLPVKDILCAVSIVFVVAACKKKDPCEENPHSIFCDAGADEVGDGDGDTGELSDMGNASDAAPESVGEHCAPLELGQIGYAHECQGTGNGWLSLTVYPAGDQPPECVNWGENGKPEEATTADCVPLDLGALPNGVPSPGACCSEGATPVQIAEQCQEDCAYAACKLAIAKMRDAAHSLPKKGPKAVVRHDLFYLANLLETPLGIANCVEYILAANGEVAAVPLGAGASDKLEFGHVQVATLRLQCALDLLEPHTPTEETCDAPPNIPIEDEKSHRGGAAAFGMVAIRGPNGPANSKLRDISYELTETRNLDGSTDFLLTDLTALATTTAYGELTYVDPTLRLLAPASGRLLDERVVFPAGSLRIEVSAAIVANQQELLFDGERITGVFANTEPAIAARTIDDTFAIVRATFEIDEHRLELSTDYGSIHPR